MSDYESHSGKLKVIERFPEETFDQLCRRIWVSNGMSEDKYEPYSLMHDLPGFEPKYLIVGETLYEIIDHKDHGEDEDSFVRIHENPDNTLSFHTRFYNGGTYLLEMLEEGVEKLKKK
jgi:hypothetical protein